MRTTKVVNILVTLALTNFVSAKSLRSRSEHVLSKRFWAGPPEENEPMASQPMKPMANSPPVQPFIDWNDFNETNSDTGDVKERVPTVTDVDIKTDISKCSEKITSKGFECCSASCVPTYSDKDGDWAVENGKWCGCGNKSIEPKDTKKDPKDEKDVDIALSRCSSKILDKGYKCCPKECRVVYTDIDGTWGIYNNKWCGCNPENDLNYMAKWIDEYNKRVNEILADDKEIEKKWLIDKERIPYDLDSPIVDKMDIKQTYICFDPEIRVREYTFSYEVTNNHEMTIKTNLTKDGLIRDETNIEINQEQYDNLVKKQEGNVIYKTRYQLLDGNNVVAIDIFHGDLDGLAYMEIEFATKDESDAYKTPDWVIKDVTDDIRYKNGHLSRYGIPELE